MNTVVDRINIDIPWKDKIAYLLLFLFPVAGMSVRHWISAIFTFLVLLSFFYLSKKAAPLLKEEKTLLWILGIFFAVFLITALANGWTERQTKYLGVEVRYLFAIPLYLMVRQLPQAGIWVLRGCVVGGMALGAQAFYDIEVLKWGRAVGVYSSNLLGPYAVLVIFWTTITFNKDKKLLIRSLIPISVACSVYAVLMSGSRGAFFGFTVLLMVWIILNHDFRRVVLATGSLVVFIILVYGLSTNVSTRIDDTFNELHSLIKIDNVDVDRDLVGGIDARLEMWRASLQLIKEHPVLGIGRGNYEVVMPEYIEKGRVPKSLEEHGLGHPHNAYLEAFVSKGVVGFLVFMVLLIYPLWCMAKNYKLSASMSLLGILHVLGFMVFSLTDASTFIKGNYSTIFLLFLIVFLSSSLNLNRCYLNNLQKEDCVEQ